MQLLIPAFAIFLLTIMAGSRRIKDIAGKDSMVLKMQKVRVKKAPAEFHADRLSVYYSRFDMIVN